MSPSHTLQVTASKLFSVLYWYKIGEDVQPELLKYISIITVAGTTCKEEELKQVPRRNWQRGCTGGYKLRLFENILLAHHARVLSCCYFL